jgi:hypothetical protein
VCFLRGSSLGSTGTGAATGGVARVGATELVHEVRDHTVKVLQIYDN